MGINLQIKQHLFRATFYSRKSALVLSNKLTIGLDCCCSQPVKVVTFVLCFNLTSCVFYCAIRTTPCLTCNAGCLHCKTYPPCHGPCHVQFVETFVVHCNGIRHTMAWQHRADMQIFVHMWIYKEASLISLISLFLSVTVRCLVFQISKSDQMICVTK